MGPHGVLGNEQRLGDIRFGTALHEHLEHLHLAHREAALGTEALAARIQTFEDRRHRSGDIQIGEDAPLREGAVVQGQYHRHRDDIGQHRHGDRGRFQLPEEHARRLAQGQG